jgi:hypothetical protein
MIQYQTLTEMLDHRSRGTGAIGYLEGEGAEKTLPLWSSCASAPSASSITCSGSAPNRATR